MRFRHLSALLPLAFVLAAHADSFQYTVNFNINFGPGDDEISTATFISPSIITSAETVAATGTANFYGGVVTGVELYPAGSCPPIETKYTGPIGCVITDITGGPGDILYFNQLPESVGTFQANLGSGNLVIGDLGPSSVTPEPSSLLLLGTGLLGAGAFFRRHLT